MAIAAGRWKVLLRLLQPDSPRHAIAAAAVTTLRRRKIDLCTALRNLVEFWAVATRPIAGNGLGMSPLLTAAEVRVLRDLFRLLEAKPGVADAWQKLASDHLVSGKQAHDAHLVAAMTVHGVRHILTFNGIDFKRHDGIEIIAPASIPE